VYHCNIVLHKKYDLKGSRRKKRKNKKKKEKKRRVAILTKLEFYATISPLLRE